MIVAELRHLLPKEQFVVIEDEDDYRWASSENVTLDDVYDHCTIIKVCSFVNMGGTSSIAVVIGHPKTPEFKRLTMRNSDGTVSQPTSTSVEQVFYRLADYEDLGYTPEELTKIIKEHTIKDC